jgi:hypothetical protein
MENNTATVEEEESQGRCGEGKAAWLPALGGAAEEGGDLGCGTWSS